MKLVVIESPYAGSVAHNLLYLRACMADSLSKGEAPYASHALYTQEGVLNDNVPEERKKGIAAGYAWADKAALIVFYTDLGWSNGMVEAITRYATMGRPFEKRQLGSDWERVALKLPNIRSERGRVGRTGPTLDPTSPLPSLDPIGPTPGTPAGGELGSTPIMTLETKTVALGENKVPMFVATRWTQTPQSIVAIVLSGMKRDREKSGLVGPVIIDGRPFRCTGVTRHLLAGPIDPNEEIALHVEPLT